MKYLFFLCVFITSTILFTGCDVTLEPVAQEVCVNCIKSREICSICTSSDGIPVEICFEEEAFLSAAEQACISAGGSVQRTTDTPAESLDFCSFDEDEAEDWKTARTAEGYGCL